MNVDGNLRLRGDAEYVCQLGPVASGMVTVSGTAYLGGSLIVQATSSLEAVGNNIRPIVAADDIAPSLWS